LLVSARGRATRTVQLPAWCVRVVRALPALALAATMFLGWQLQALFGLVGPSVTALRARPWNIVRSSMFLSLPPSRPSARTSAWQVAARARAERLGLGDRRAASNLLLGQVEPAWRAEAEHEHAGDGTLEWPVADGWFGRGYGSGMGGYHLAIDINAAAGSDVMAAAPGVVGYVGRELAGSQNRFLERIMSSIFHCPKMNL